MPSDKSASPPPPDASTARRASLMLILSTLFWGLSFPLMKQWQVQAVECPGGDLIASHTLMALRACLGLLLLAALRPSLLLRATRREFQIGACLGLLNFAGVTLQMLGLAKTTPALSGFFTSLSSAFVPLLAFLWFGTLVARPTLWGLLLGLAGAAVLGVDPKAEWLLGGGEALTLLSAVIFAVMILALDRWGRTVESSRLMGGLIVFTGLPALVYVLVGTAQAGETAAWGNWLSGMLQEPRVVGNVVTLTVCSTVLSTLWMVAYQPRVPAARAALIYFLEPLFALGFSVAFGFDSPSTRLVLGGGLILLRNALVELPLWLRSDSPP